MPPKEISYWPSLLKQFLFLALMLSVFIVSAAASLILWLNGIVWWLLIVVGVVSAACMPLMLVMLLLRSPVLVLTPDGVRLRGNVSLRWEEIDEIHEYVQRSPIQQVLIGLYLRDEEAVRARLSLWAKWEMNHHKKQGLPPIVIWTPQLRESTAEIMDDIEAYLEELPSEKGKRRKLPTVHRRKE